MNELTNCSDKWRHRKCAHATMRRLADAAESAQIEKYDGVDFKVGFVGIRSDHWHEFVRAQEDAQIYIEAGVFQMERMDLGRVFVVPLAGQPEPRILLGEELEEFLKEDEETAANS